MTPGDSTADGLPWDWALLARPISPEKPSGESLRYEGSYDQLMDARRFDDPSLPQGIWETSLKRADWKRVSTMALDLLMHRSKDLQVAVWLADSEIRLRGFQGAADSLRLLTLLVVKFWETLHPEFDEDDDDVLAARLAPLEWFANKAPDILRLVPISVATPKAPRAFSMADWSVAQNIERLSRRNPAVLQQASREGTANFAEIKLGALELPVRTRDQWFASLRAAITEVGNLSRELDERCGRQAPSFGKMLEQLHDIERFYLTLFPKLSEIAMKIPGSRETRMPPVDPEKMAQEPEPAAAPSRDALSGIIEVASANYGIASREEAFAQLEAVSQYLMRTEPHSPVPYLIRRAVAWGEMSFGELLAQFIHDPKELHRLYGFLGINEGEIKTME